MHNRSPTILKMLILFKIVTNFPIRCFIVIQLSFLYRLAGWLVEAISFWLSSGLSMLSVFAPFDMQPTYNLVPTISPLNALGMRLHAWLVDQNSFQVASSCYLKWSPFSRLNSKYSFTLICRLICQFSGFVCFYVLL